MPYHVKKIFVCANRGWIPSYDLIMGMSVCEFWQTNTLLTLFFNERNSWEKGFIETPNKQSPDHELMIEMGRYNYNQTTKDNGHCPLRGSELIEDVRRRLLWSYLAGPSAFSQKMGQLTFELIVLKKTRSLSKQNCLISSQFFILNVTFSYFKLPCRRAEWSLFNSTTRFQTSGYCRAGVVHKL